MSIRTTSLVPFTINNIPDRYTPVYVTDRTVVTTTAGTGAVKRLNRLQSATFKMATNVVEIIEMGAQFRPGGVDDLGEASWSTSWLAVGINNLAAVCGTAVSAVAGATTTISQTNLNNNPVDFIRLVADPNGNIFGTLYLQDAIITDWTVDAKEKAAITEMVSGKGPNATFFPGYIIPKVYVVTPTDVTNGYLTLTSIFGADEQATQIFLPGATNVPSYWEQNGASYFLKIEKVPGAVLTNTPIRYIERNVGFFQNATTAGTKYVTPSAFLNGADAVGKSINFGVGTANQETLPILAIVSQVNTNSGSSTATVGAATITPVSMLGIQAGVTLQCVNASGTNAESLVVTSVTSTTFTATFASTKATGFLITSKSPSYQVTFGLTHALNDPMNAALSLTNGTSGGSCAFLATSNRLYCGDTLVSGDAFRLVVLSYNTDSLPTTIPANSPDTTDRPGVNSRIVPLTIAALGTNRVQSASYKMTLKRDQAQGIGENAIAYGISSVPDVAVSIDAKETDLTLLAQLSTGSRNLTAQGGTIAADFQDLNYITRVQLQNAIASQIVLHDPYNAVNILCTWNLPQLVIKDIDYSSSNKADNTVKLTGIDITGNMTVSQTNPA